MKSPVFHQPRIYLAPGMLATAAYDWWGPMPSMEKSMGVFLQEGALVLVLSVVKEIGHLELNSRGERYHAIGERYYAMVLSSTSNVIEIPLDYLNKIPI